MVSVKQIVSSQYFQNHQNKYLCFMSLLSLACNYLKFSIFRNKRQIADVRIMEEQAKMALIRHMPSGCQEVACGIFDPFARYINREIRCLLFVCRSASSRRWTKDCSCRNKIHDNISSINLYVHLFNCFI